MPSTNGFNDNNTIFFATGLELDGLDKGLNTAEKKIRKAQKDGKVDIEVSTEGLEEIAEIREEAQKLKRDIKKLATEKAPRSSFEDFKKKTVARFEEIEQRLDHLQGSLKETIDELQKVGVSVNLTDTIGQFKEATKVVKATGDAIEEVIQITKGTNAKVEVDISGIKELQNALEALTKAKVSYDKVSDDEYYMGFSEDATPTLEQYVGKFKQYIKLYKEAFAEVKETTKAYDALPDDAADDILLPSEAKMQAAKMRLGEISTVIIRLKTIIEELQQDTGKTFINFDEMNQKLQVFQLDEMAERGEKAANAYKELSFNIQGLHKKSAEAGTLTERPFEEATEKIQKAVTEQLRLSDLLKGKSIDIRVTTNIEELQEELTEQLNSLQDRIKKETLVIPIKIAVESAKERSNDPNKVAQSTYDRARASLENVSLDADKLSEKALKKVLKTSKDSIRDFVSSIKSQLASIFDNKYDLKFKVSETDLQEAEKKLQADALLGKLDLSKNITNANEIAKELAKNLKTVLELATKASEKEIKTDYSATTTAKKTLAQENAELKNKLKEYDSQMNQIREHIQKEVLDKKPLYVKLDVKPTEFTKISEKISNGIQINDVNITESLRVASNYAQDIVEKLKPLNGLSINIASKGSSTKKDDWSVLLLVLNQISTRLDYIKDLFANLKTNNADKDLKQVSVDFTDIISKIDILIDKSDKLTTDLKKDIDSIKASIESLAKSLNEQTIHTVVEELNGIDLSKLETELTNISGTIKTVNDSLETINNSLHQMEDNSLEAQWRKIASLFDSIVGDSNTIDLRRTKQLKELLDLYSNYKKVGGTNTFDNLTANATILEKLQKFALKNNGEKLTIVDNNRLRETADKLQQIDVLLSSITTSLSSINGLENVSKVFNALNIKDDTLNRILELPDNLKAISDKIRELDKMPYNGFIDQLTKITAQADGLKALAEILKKSNKQINAALDLMKKEPNDAYKALMNELDASKELDKLFTRYSKKGTFETSQPKEYAEVLELIKEKLQQIEDIREFHKRDEKTEAATIGQIYDSRKVHSLVEEIKDLFDWLDNIKLENKTLLEQLEQEQRVTRDFAKEFKKISEGDGTKERRYSDDYYETLRKIRDILKETQRFEGIKVGDENSVLQLKNYNVQLESFFNTLRSIITYTHDVDKSLKDNLSEYTKKVIQYERDYKNAWNYGANEKNYGARYQDLLYSINTKIKELKNLGKLNVITDKDIENAKILDIEITQLFLELKNMEALAKNSNITNLENRIAQYMQKNTRLTANMYNQLSDLLIQLGEGSKLTKEEISNIAASFNKVKYAAKMAGKEGAGFFDAIRNKLKYGWAQSIAMFFSFYDIVRYVREVSSAITEINSNLIELAKVSNASIGELYKDFKDFKDVAQETGGTINDIIQATADWSRNGFSLAESKELARLSSIFQNIGDGLTANQSNEYLVSTIKGFNLEAKDAIEILDIINNVSNHTASSVSNIGEALERSSSAFGAAKTDLKQAVALLTTSNEVLQSPETVGTAFKSMSARLRSSTTELEEMGEELTLTTSKLRELVKALTGVDIQKDENTFKSIYDILYEIGQEWNNLTDVEQASLSEALFGKRNSQVGFSILNNVERLAEVYQLAKDSAGSAMAEQEKYLEGIQYQIDYFKASVESLANTFMSSDFLKGAIKSGTQFINILDKLIERLGTIPTLMAGIGAILGARGNVLFDALSFGLTKNTRSIPITANTDISALAGANNLKSAKILIDEYNTSFSNLARITKTTKLSHDEFIASVNLGNNVLAEYLNTLGPDSAATLKGYQQFLIKTTAKTIALRTATALLQGALFTLVSYGINLAVSAWQKYHKTSEEIIEDGQKARQIIKDVDDNLKNQQKVAKNSIQRFAELSQGIEKLSGKNLTLSDSDYEEFLDLSQQLIDVFPSLSHHYDENGNAIIDLSGDVDTIVGSLWKLVDVEKEIAKQKILENFDISIEGALEKDKQYADEISKIESQILDKETKLNKIRKNLKTEGIIQRSDIEDYEHLLLVLEGLGIAYEENDIQDAITIDKSLLDNNTIDMIIDYYDNEYEQLIDKLELKTTERRKEVNDLMGETLAAYLDYSNLNDTVKSFLSNLLYNFDWTESGLTDPDAVETFVQHLADQFSTMTDEEANTYIAAFDIKTKYNNQEVTVSEYNKAMDSLLESVDKLYFTDDLDGKKENAFKKAINTVFDLETDVDGNRIDTTRNRIQKKVNKLLSSIDFDNKDVKRSVRGAINDFVEDLNKDDYELFASLNINKEESLKNIYKTREQIEEEMRRLQVGNVDLFDRPRVKDSKMVQAGWTELEGSNSISTVYSSSYNIFDKEGKELIVHVTPILQNGTVLSPKALDDYVFNVLEGSEDVLNTDKDEYNIVLRVDTDLSEEGMKNVEKFGEDLHILQELWYVPKTAQETADEYYDTLDNILKEAKAAKAAPFEIEFNEKEITQASKGVKRLQEVYQDLYEAHANGKMGADLASSYEDLNKLLEESSKDAGDAINVSTETWKKFYDTMSSGNHSFEEMESALNEVMTEYIDGTIKLESFDRQQASAISTQLQLAGVTKESADAYVEMKVNQAEAIKEAEDAGRKMLTLTAEQVETLKEEKHWTDEVAESVALCALEKQVANGLTINTDADINNLIELCSWAGVTSDSLERLLRLKAALANAQESLKAQKSTKNVYRGAVNLQTEINNYEKEIEQLENEAELDLSDAIAEKRAELAALKFDQSKAKDASKSGSSKEEDAWKKAYEKELAALDHLHEMELISDIKYYEEREKLNDKYFKDREKYTEEYNKNLEEIYKGFQSAYKQYVDDMSDYWKKSLDAGQLSFKEYCNNMKKMLDDLHNAQKIDNETYFTQLSEYYGTIVENYDKVISAVQRKLKEEIDILNDDKDALKKDYEARKKLVQTQIDSLQEEIDALEDANKKRQEALDLQKAMYALNRAENQRPNYVYTSDKGFTYMNAEADIKEAQEQLDDVRYQQKVSALESSIESLEEELDLLDTELDELTQKLEDQIDALQEYSDKWGEVADKYEQAQEDMIAAAVLGSNWQNEILALNESTLSTFTTNYISMQKSQADAAIQAAKEICQAYTDEINALKQLQIAQENAKAASSNVGASQKSSSVGSKDDTTTITPTEASKIKVPSTSQTRSVYVYNKTGANSTRSVYVYGNKSKYGSGTKNAQAGYHEVAENGDEIIVDNDGNAFLAKGRQLHKFEGGERVYSESETNALLSGKYIPIDSILPNYSSMLSKVVSSGINASMNNMSNVIASKNNYAKSTETSGQTIDITIGDIHITEVDNATEIAKAIKNKLPNAILQELKK